MMKDVPEYEGLYTVDEMGHVYSTRANKMLKESVMQNGYKYVHLCDGKNHTKSVRIHRIVAKAFLNNENQYAQVNHINGDKKDNRVANLEWCSREQNIKHAMKTGLFNTNGENNPSAKLTKQQVDEIRKEYIYGSKHHGTTALAAKYGVTNVMIGKIVRHECWRDVDHSLHRAEGDV